MGPTKCHEIQCDATATRHCQKQTSVRRSQERSARQARRFAATADPWGWGPVGVGGGGGRSRSAPAPSVESRKLAEPGSSGCAKRLVRATPTHLLDTTRQLPLTPPLNERGQSYGFHGKVPRGGGRPLSTAGEPSRQAGGGIRGTPARAEMCLRSCIEAPPILPPMRRGGVSAPDTSREFLRLTTPTRKRSQKPPKRIADELARRQEILTPWGNLVRTTDENAGKTTQFC
jgi:hypothetical protein